jgi:hypothetical protein
MGASKIKLRVALLLGLLAVSAAYLYWGDTSVRQARRLKLANQHLPAVRAVLASSADFESLQAGGSTGLGGVILIIGRVPSAEALAQLKLLLDKTKSPVDLVYQVDIIRPEQPTTPKSPVIEAREYLVRHQSPDGSWGATPESCTCGGKGASSRSKPGDLETTAWSILAFAGAGYSELNSDILAGRKVADVVRGALDWIIPQLDREPSM